MSGTGPSTGGVILTVTPNPSLDRTYEVPSLDRGEVIRATGERMDPGGKGVNVSRAAAAAGRRTVAVLPLGVRRAHSSPICWPRRASRSRRSRSPEPPARTSRSRSPTAS